MEKTNTNIQKINEIYDKQSDGLCDSCEYGIDKCLEQQYANCKKEEDTNA